MPPEMSPLDPAKTAWSTIMHRIAHEQQKPRWHFVLQSVIFSLSIALGLLILVYCGALLFFVYRLEGGWYIPVRGWQEFADFLLAAPWIIVGLAIIGIVLVAYVVRHYSFVCRQPFIFGFTIVACVALMGGYMTERVLTYIRFSHKALIYHPAWIRPPQRGRVHIGTVISQNEKGITIFTQKGKEVLVDISHATTLYTQPRVNDTVWIYGDKSGDEIFARYVEIINDDYYWGREQKIMK